MFVVKWISGEAKGYDDHIPNACVKHEGLSPLVEHAITGPKGWLKIARCSVTVAGKHATFDYDGDHRSWNEKQEFYIGQMLFEFETPKRSGTPRLYWKEEGETEFTADYGYVVRRKVTKALLSGIREGDKNLAMHLESERYPLARFEKLTHVLETRGKITCEVCNTDHQKRYGTGGLAAYEVHHRKQIKSGMRITNLSDLAILCATCHRVIHSTSPLQSVEAFKETLKR